MASGLTKTQLVRHLAEKTELPNKTVTAFLEELADVAVKETKKNGVFVVPGLGRLVKAHRKARVGRNPQTSRFRSRQKLWSSSAWPRLPRMRSLPKSRNVDLEIDTEGRLRPAFYFLQGFYFANVC